MKIGIIIAIATTSMFLCTSLVAQPWVGFKYTPEFSLSMMLKFGVLNYKVDEAGDPTRYMSQRRIKFVAICSESTISNIAFSHSYHGSVEGNSVVGLSSRGNLTNGQIFNSSIFADACRFDCFLLRKILSA